MLTIYWTKASKFNKKTQTLREYYEFLNYDKESLTEKRPGPNPNIIAQPLINLVVNEKNVDETLFKKECNLVIGPMLSIVFNQLQKKMEEFALKQKDLLSQLNKALLEGYGAFYVDALANEIQIRELSGKGFNSLTTLRKEQKQHCFARFFNLINYYTAFVNSVYLLNKEANKKMPEFKDIAKKVVLFILENCHIELTGKSNTEANKKLITINHDGHREPDIMGRESADDTVKADGKTTVGLLNVLFGMHENKEMISELQRAHTLPFPACFAWDDEKLIAFISNETNVSLKRKRKDSVLADDTQYLKQEELLFNSKLFMEISKKGINHTEIEALFADEFKGYAENKENSFQFLYSSIELLRKFYIRLFSETALLPDFVNREMDHLSEWRKKDGENNYKIALRTSLQELIRHDRLCDKMDVTSSLKPFLKESAAAVVKCHEKLFPEKSEKALFKRISVCQVEKSMRAALYGVASPDLINEIFSRSVLDHPEV